MQNKITKEELNKQKEEEENINNDIPSSDEENSEKDDQEDSPKMNLASFITTPYERVLSIINEAKKFILSVSSTQQNLIKGLEWAIKVISSHNLYAYELKDQESSKDNEANEDFKQFVQFVNSYNDVIPTKTNEKKGKSFLLSSNLKRPTAFKYNISKIEEEKSVIKEENIENEKDNKDDTNTKNNKNIEDKSSNVKIHKSKSNNDSSMNNNKITKSFQKLRNNRKSNNKLIKNDKSEFSKTQKTNKIVKPTKKIKPFSPIRNIKKTIFNVLTPKNEKVEAKLIRATSQGQSRERIKVEAPIQKGGKGVKSFNRLKTENIGGKNNLNSLNNLKKEKPIDFEHISLNKSFTKYSSNLLENALIDINYPPSRIIEKTFNIFELKEIIGQDNVLPIMGKVILDSFGLYSDEIISTEKLDPFLVSISNQYYKTTLYHNSMHGADVTQSLCLYFLNSNAEEICQSLVLDLLGILIAALGHDLGHPGLTNLFHINSSSELAITYNDVSCLENFHTSKLFRTIRNPETDIFEKLSVQDYKTIRKRMIGNILSTDMANHGKIMTVIKSRIAINKAENKTKFELLSGNEKTKFEEQQSLFDFLIHSADLAHNTKLFNISLKWVELLSEEFWLQGDKEKSMNLPVSFLCDRDNYNIPNSQVGFIKGFIIPTFDCLINIFPSLKYTMDNAKTNLKKWEKLAAKGRKKGWTPEKTKQVNYKKKMILFSAINSINEYNEKIFKRKSGNVNSLSHALQVKEYGKDNSEPQEKTEDKKNNKDGKNKIKKPNIIIKNKNHDKKVSVYKLQKYK
jgi:hypothetical protein